MAGKTGRLESGRWRSETHGWVGEVRVFYDVSGSTVEILAIVAKPEAQSWLEQFGSRA
jgi:hypothetical protein